MEEQLKQTKQALGSVAEEGFDETPAGKTISRLHELFNEKSDWSEEQIFRFIQSLDFTESNDSGVELALEVGVFEAFVDFTLESVAYFKREFNVSDPVDLYIDSKSTGDFSVKA